MNSFDESNFVAYCDKLAKKDKDLRAVIKQYDYPPLWRRLPSFSTLIHIILEQQVSLASAKAAFLKLEAKIGHITPEKLLLLSNEEMKDCYFSRQKTLYARHLAAAVIDNSFSIEQLQTLEDDALKTAMKKIKGIGEWTADVFMMMALHRCDCFPAGDIALIKSVKKIKQLPAHTTKEEVLFLANAWKPYRTIAAFICWHAYIKKRNIVF